MIYMPKTKKIVSYLFVALFSSYYASTTLFSHIHIISGANIVHSHIHTDAHHDTKSGGHTERSITLIAQISKFDQIDFSGNLVPTSLQFQLLQNKFIEVTDWVPSIYFQNPSLRAPPMV